MTKASYWMHLSPEAVAPLPHLALVACANLVYWRSELQEANLSVYASRVLMDLAMRGQGKDGGAFPSYTTIEKDCGISRPTVRRALQELKRAGLIRVKKGGGKVNQYTIVSLEEWQAWRARKLGSNINQLTTDPSPTSKPQTLHQLTSLTSLGSDVNSKELPLKRSNREEESADAQKTLFPQTDSSKPTKRKFNQLPSLSELVDYCAKRRLPESDAIWLHDHWLGNGFTNGGEPIRGWQATIRSWQQPDHAYFPSQKKKQSKKTFKP